MYEPPSAISFSSEALQEPPAAYLVTPRRLDTPTALGALDAAGRSEYWAALALGHTPGLGGRRCKRLLDTFGSAFGAVQQVKEWEKAGIEAPHIQNFLTEHWRQTAITEWNAARTLVGHIILWTDAHYPPLLRELPDAPARLYAQGDLSLLSSPCIGIVGTRNCSEGGARTARAFAGALAASGITIVSGMALGVDREAHLASVDLTGSTIGVLGAGLDVNYPAQNLDLRRKILAKGLLLSEYAPGVQAEPHHFPIRNRLISGLALGILVIEAAVRSGSLITARLALEQNRAVYAIAGGIGEKQAAGCQKLIREGARPVFGSADILEDLAPLLRQTSPHSHTPRVKTISEVVPVPHHPKEQPTAQNEDTIPETAQTLSQGTTLPSTRSSGSGASETPPLHSGSSITGTFEPASSGKPSSRVPKRPSAQSSQGTTPCPQKVPQAATAEVQILSLLGHKGPLTADDILQALTLDIAVINATLILLEIQGSIVQQSDLRYALI